MLGPLRRWWRRRKAIEAYRAMTPAQRASVLVAARRRRGEVGFVNAVTTGDGQTFTPVTHDARQLEIKHEARKSRQRQWERRTRDA